MKPIHGAPKPKDVPSDMTDTPPVPCEFSVGNVVTYTNDYGVKFRARVRGFTRKLGNYTVPVHVLDLNGKTVRTDSETVTPGFVYLEFWQDWLNAYTTDGSAWWFPHKPNQLQKLPA